LFVAALHFAASSPNVLMVEWDQTDHGLGGDELSLGGTQQGDDQHPAPYEADQIG
jgi:hypothetical protein